jgi:hypothetical protein
LDFCLDCFDRRQYRTRSDGSLGEQLAKNLSEEN